MYQVKQSLMSTTNRLVWTIKTESGEVLTHRTSLYDALKWALQNNQGKLVIVKHNHAAIFVTLEELPW